MDRAVLITGASRGIGAAVARRFAREGWRVGVNYRTSRGRAEALAAEIAAAGGQTALLPGDVSDPAQAAALVRAAEELCPRVRDLCLSVQTGGGELERYLHRQYGVALRPDWDGVQATIRFDPRAEEAGQAVLSLFGPEADLAGLAVSVPGLERQKEGQWLPLLEILWETGRLERTDLEFT